MGDKISVPMGGTHWLSARRAPAEESFFEVLLQLRFLLLRMIYSA